MSLVTHPTQIGRILAARRKALGLSQQELATRLNVSQNRLSELELAPERLTVERLLVALNLLGLEMVVRERSSKPKPTTAEW
jgi:HTH-type transcriptional regulator/antitoxin HipB